MPALFALIGRVLLAAIFIYAGYGKLMAHAGTVGYIAHGGLPMPELAYVVAVAVELGGGILLLIGWQARAVAAVLALFCIVTAVVFHSDFADRNMMIHFMKNLAIAGGMLQVTAFGGGALSLDGRNESGAGALSGASV